MATRHRNRPEPASQPTSASDLTQLLETEARLEELLRRAREQADRLVAEARAAAQAREAGLATELEEAARRLEAEIAAERVRREQEVTETARRDAEMFDHVPAGRIDELARYVVDRLIEGAG